MAAEKVVAAAIRDGLLSRADANTVYQHLKALTLKNLGVIKYDYKLGDVAGAAWSRNEPLLEKLAKAISDEIEDLAH